MRSEARTRGHVRWTAAFLFLGLCTVVGLTLAYLFARSDSKGVGIEIVVSDTEPFQGAEWIPPAPPFQGERLPRITLQGARGCLEVPLGTGAPENREGYIKRMLAAIGQGGKLARVLDSTSCTSDRGDWIARLDTLLLLTHDGRLDPVLLLTVRNLKRDIVSPRLCRSRWKGRPVLGAHLQSTTFQGTWGQPLGSWLRPPRPGFQIVLETDPGIDASALLAEFQARAFVPLEN